MIERTTVFLIVGLGLIGGSYAYSLSQQGFAVYGSDIDEEAVAYAKANGFIRAEDLAEEEKLRRADMVIFAMYPDGIASYVRKYRDLFKPGAILTDVAGVKVPLMRELEKILPPQIDYISHHPMAGGERKGILHAKEVCYSEANFLVVPFKRTTGIDALYQLGTILGFQRIETISPEEHDRWIGYLSQLPHAIAMALMNAKDVTHGVRYSGDSFRDLTRIARMNESLWVDLFLSNKEILVEEIDGFIRALSSIREALEQNDAGALKQKMTEATERREKFDL